MDIFIRNFGSKHEKVALTLNYLAEVYRLQGKYTYDGAEQLYLQYLLVVSTK